MGRYFDPLNPIAFRRLFGTERNKDILLRFLNTILRNQIYGGIKKITFLPSFKDPEHIIKKQSTVDVLCEDMDGCKYIVEMLTTLIGGFERRAQHYANKAFIPQVFKGGKYEDLKKVIFIAFTELDVFLNDKYYKSENVKIDSEDYLDDMDLITFTYIELQKFQEIVGRKKEIEEMNLEERFYYFLFNAEYITADNMERLNKNAGILEKAFSEIDKSYWTDKEILRYGRGY